MKQKLSSESGIFILRVLLSLLLCTVGVWLAVVSLQAQPQANSFQLAGGSVPYPSGWMSRDYANMHELWNTTPQNLASLPANQRDEIARIRTSVTSCATHAEALHRLREVEAESVAASQYITIGGWPALVRQQLIDKPREGDADSGENEKLFMVTTAIAAGTTVVRMDGFAPQTASPDLLNQIASISQNWQPAVPGNSATSNNELQQLRSGPSLRMAPAASPGTSPAGPSSNARPAPSSTSLTATPAVTLNLGATNNLQIGSESEIAVSSDGAYVVVAQQCSDSSSLDGGATFTGGSFPAGHCSGGDSSVAFGKSGNFYWETIDSNSGTCPGSNNCNNTQGMSRSTNHGQTFSFVTNIIDCQVTSGCGFGNVPDQEHIAADRVNSSGSSQDQVYMAFRQGFGFGLTCSNDNAATWKAVAFYNNGSTDFPRIRVGPDGTVYVVTNNGNNIELWSFSSCSSGLTPGLNHVTIASGINQVVCPVSGLDRCNNGNILSSHTVEVDDTNASHLYASYAANTTAPPSTKSFPGNEDVYVEESTDGGNTWSSPVQINGGTSGTGGRRFQPWVSVTQGKAYVSWFDRRASASGTNDLTDYYAASASDSPGLSAGSEFQIDTNADPQCATGWPCGSRSPNDSGSCSTQPQLGGFCRHSPNNNTDSFTPCNFASPACPATESCQTGSGCPKYADYTGNAALLGRFYTAYPSATSQPGTTATGGNINMFFSETVVGPTDTTTTYTGDTSDGAGSTANVSATLVLKGTAVPVPGKTISFTIGSQSCSNTTDSTGLASCSINLTQTAGPYTVTANFTGMGNYNASSNSVSFTIAKVTPNISTTPSAATTLSKSISDMATVSGGFNPTGTVTFDFYGYNDTTCGSSPVFTSTNPLSGGHATSSSYTPTLAGIYHIIARYNGDTSNNPVSTNCADESVMVSATSVTGSGTIFTHNNQASFNFMVSDKNGPLTGTLTYTDVKGGMKLTSTLITEFTVLGPEATIRGAATIPNSKPGGKPIPVSFSAFAVDNGNPGTPKDMFSIQISTPYYGTGHLTSGNIAIK
jgi:hypothetical protein